MWGNATHCTPEPKLDGACRSVMCSAKQKWVVNMDHQTGVRGVGAEAVSSQSRESRVRRDIMIIVRLLRHVWGVDKNAGSLIPWIQ